MFSLPIVPSAGLLSQNLGCPHPYYTFNPLEVSYTLHNSLSVLPTTMKRKHVFNMSIAYVISFESSDLPSVGYDICKVKLQLLSPH